MDVIGTYALVFDGNLNQYEGPVVTLKLQVNADPKLLRAQMAPFALKKSDGSRVTTAH